MASQDPHDSQDPRVYMCRVFKAHRKLISSDLKDDRNPFLKNLVHVLYECHRLEELQFRTSGPQQCL